MNVETNKAKLTVELEKHLTDTVNQQGYEKGLSVHQIIGAMRVVEHQLTNKWETQKKEALNLLNQGPSPVCNSDSGGRS